MKKVLLMLFSILTCLQIMAQTRPLRGVVTDSRDGSPLPGVSVMVRGTTTGTSTGDDGSFTVNVADNATLVFNFIGFESYTVPVAGKTSLNV